jgi:hypothetical protein
VSPRCLVENKNGRLAWKVHVGHPFGVPWEMRLLDWGYAASWKGFKCGLDTDTRLGVSAWMWGLFRKRLPAFGQKGCSRFLFSVLVSEHALMWGWFCVGWVCFCFDWTPGLNGMGVGDTTGEARRFARLLKKGEHIVERLNSGDYMEFGRTVKARRRRIFPLNILMRPVKTPLFPTGEMDESVAGWGHTAIPSISFLRVG